jgi:hypothetical protein
MKVQIEEVLSGNASSATTLKVIISLLRLGHFRLRKDIVQVHDGVNI